MHFLLKKRDARLLQFLQAGGDKGRTIAEIISFFKERCDKLCDVNVAEGLMEYFHAMGRAELIYEGEKKEESTWRITKIGGEDLSQGLKDNSNLLEKTNSPGAKVLPQVFASQHF